MKEFSEKKSTNLNNFRIGFIRCDNNQTLIINYYDKSDQIKLSVEKNEIILNRDQIKELIGFLESV